MHIGFRCTRETSKTAPVTTEIMAVDQDFLVLILVILQYSVTFIEAAAAVSFQFLQPFSLIQAETNMFSSQLTADLRSKYGFTNQQIQSIQVSVAESGSIQVDFSLDINTRNSSQVSRRAKLSTDLTMSRYVFLFTNSSGARHAFLVDGGSASVTPSFWDGWDQFAPDIAYAVLVGLAILAIFCAGVYCVILRRQKKKRNYVTNAEPTIRSMAHHANGIDNEGFMVELNEVTQPTQATLVSRDLHHSLTQLDTPVSRPSSEQQYPPPPKSRNSTVAPPSSEPMISMRGPTPPVRIALTLPAAAHSPNVPPSPKPPNTPRLRDRVATIPGSVRSLSQFLGVSTQSTPASSRRSSVAGPSIYARLLYASYSVPPKKIYDYI